MVEEEEVQKQLQQNSTGLYCMVLTESRAMRERAAGA
jgi:hypothetical protein